MSDRGRESDGHDAPDRPAPRVVDVTLTEEECERLDEAVAEMRAERRKLVRRFALGEEREQVARQIDPDRVQQERDRTSIRATVVRASAAAHEWRRLQEQGDGAVSAASGAAEDGA